MIPVSICFGGFIAFSNLSLQYNTVGTYQLIKLQVTPSTCENEGWAQRLGYTCVRVLIREENRGHGDAVVTVRVNRTCTPFILAVMVISSLFFKAHYPLPIILSFVPVFVGTLISTYYDLNFNQFGLFCK